MYKVEKEVKAIRDFYRISRKTLHIISGIGINQIAEYEKGSIPNKSNYLLIMSIVNINGFERLFHASKNLLKSNTIERIEKKIEKETKWRHIEAMRYKYELMEIMLKQ